LVWKDKIAKISQALAMNDVAVDGLFSVEQGVIFSAMIFAALTVEIIERRLLRAAAWAFAGALLSAIGFIHSFVWDFKDAPMSLHPAWPWVIAYAAMGSVLVAMKFLTVPDSNPHM
jgi:AGZA family xanthine/uracil permease-like MFS transporter